MESLPNFGLANTVTGFATLFSGLLPLLFCALLAPQPRRWHIVYVSIAITGVFTVTLHGFGETNPIWGDRWFWAFLDTGSNIVVIWCVGMAILGDYYRERTRKWAVPVLTSLMLCGVSWHYYDRMPTTQRVMVIPLGDWGGFYPGETWLIAFSWLGVGLFIAKWHRIPAKARKLLIVTWIIFFLGMLLATASNSKIVYPFIPLHALWHLVSGCGFIVLWAFNHARFAEENSCESRSG